ncbi:MAG: single-stranded-DNA-specific exonuclease RecJ [Candidatus Omnitrophota bacterium]|nr:single-stranded-DNA-specific exonuclease RecJ [Candidatus Omnitrophota bacterium]
MQKRWNVAKPEPLLRVSLAKALNIPPVLAQVLINRNVKNKEDAEVFMRSDMSFLHSPLSLPDIDKAVKRMKQAIEKKEKIFIFGDYDVDGVTSCALLKLTLEKLGARVKHCIPHRLRDGYGINEEAVSFAGKEKIDLFISVDCGITNFKEIELLNASGIDSIIIDHHEPQEKLPNALAVVDPKLKGHNYPFRDLAAVGVVYKLCQKLCDDLLVDDLDLVLLGTVADVVPLLGENRILVKEGLLCLSQTRKPGLKALIDICRIRGRKLDPYAVSFILGPRLNAAGRMSSAEIAFNLLTAVSHSEAEDLARQLDVENRRRQEIEKKILDEALAKVEREVNFKDHSVIVLSCEGWHQGVLGIVASRIADRFYRPAIIISTEGSLGKGSARSIRDFHIFNALCRCGEFLEGYGGHSHAAGLTILEANIEKFKHLINDIARIELTPQDLIRCLDIDAEVNLAELSLDLVSGLDNLAPFGAGNPEPLFLSSELFVRGRPNVLGKNTLKFWVYDGRLTFPVVGFGMGDKFGLVSENEKLDLVYSASLDTWQDNRQIQLNLKDVRPSRP